jgi:hypothetical protein
MSFDIKLNFESGYFENKYQRNYLKNFKNSLVSNDYKVTSIDYIAFHELDSGIFMNFVISFKNWGYGFSSGIKGILNNTIISYKRSTDSIPYAQLKVNSYVFPQNLSIFFSNRVNKNINLKIGFGSGYYIFYNKWTTLVDGSRRTNDYKLFSNDDIINHTLGFLLFFELSCEVAQNFSLLIGLKGNCILLDDFQNIIPGGHIYVGIQEVFWIR